jgi:hypothetical protein
MENPHLWTQAVVVLIACVVVGTWLAAIASRKRGTTILPRGPWTGDSVDGGEESSDREKVQ